MSQYPRIGVYGREWILRVTEIHSGYFCSTVPARWGEPMFDDAGLAATFEAPAADSSPTPTVSLWTQAGMCT